MGHGMIVKKMRAFSRFHQDLFAEGPSVSFTLLISFPFPCVFYRSVSRPPASTIIRFHITADIIIGQSTESIVGCGVC